MPRPSSPSPSDMSNVTRANIPNLEYKEQIGDLPGLELMAKGDWEALSVLPLDAPAEEGPADTPHDRGRIGQDDHLGCDQKDDSRGVLLTPNGNQGRKQRRSRDSRSFRRTR